MKRTRILLGAWAATLPSMAMAQPVTGPYVSLGAGANIFQGDTVRSISAPALGFGTTIDDHLNYKTNFGAAAGLGWGFGNGFRAELSGNYLRNDAKSSDGYGAHGHTDAFGGFANVLYDYDLAAWGAPGFVPYIGGGIGYEERRFHTTELGATGGNLLTLQGGKGNLAFDAIVGIAYNIAAVPGLAITAEYRYTAIPENLGFGGTATPPIGSSGSLHGTTDGFNAHTGLIGLRYALWQPPEPPAAEIAPPAAIAAPPPVQEARTYLVFFDWDRADLTTRARQIVAEAAQASTHVQTTRIAVNGYTDLSGTAIYNQKLSLRRAQTVQAELVRDGVAQGAIGIQGFGETHPLVATAQGVREPQNRRVEIILQ